MRSEPTGVCVFAPSTLVTVTVEAPQPGTTAGDSVPEIHFHAGGQGFWIARLLARLGVPVTLCSVFGGEAGRVARALVECEEVEVRAVDRQAPSGAYVHDRRSGEREVVASAPGGPLTRHEVDELYGAALTTAVERGVCILTGPAQPGVLSGDVYRRLAGDLRRLGIWVIADLSGDHLEGALAGGVDVVKVSDEDLHRDGMITGRSLADAVDAVFELHRQGARHVLVSRGDEPLVALLDGELVEVAGPRLEPLDHRGCGDSLTALFGAGAFWHLPNDLSVRWGAAAGALTATRRGLATADRREIHRLAALVDVRPLDPASPHEAVGDQPVPPPTALGDHLRRRPA